MKERLLRLCAKGKVAINVRGMEYLQTNPARTRTPRGGACAQSFRSRAATSTTCS